MSYDIAALGIALGGQETPYKKGVVLARPEEVQPVSFIILEGIVKQYDIRDNGTSVTLNLYKEGSILALPWILAHAPSQSFFECATDCTLITISTTSLRQAFADNPDLTLATLTRVSQGLDGLFRRLAAHSTNDAQYRITTELAIEAARFGVSRGTGTEVHIGPSELAVRTGLSRETVSRHIHRLIAQGQLQRVPRGFVIQDP